MGQADFDAVMAIAGERDDIRVIISSTPTGRRAHFYNACTNKAMGFNEHFHPSTHNPNWNIKMETEFKAMLSEQGYAHEILAEFGTQDTGVFNKDKLDAALTYQYYAYEKLDYYQEQRARFEQEEHGRPLKLYLYDKLNPAPYNPLRTVGIDWDKYKHFSNECITISKIA